MLYSTGVGYHLYIVKNSSCIADNILEVIKTHVPEVQLESNVGTELSFDLPKEQSARFEELFAELEQNQDSLGIGSFGVSAPSLEEVFLKWVFYLSRLQSISVFICQRHVSSLGIATTKAADEQNTCKGLRMSGT